MDTKDAITTIQALSVQLRQNAKDYSAQADALDIAISQLQGTLQTEIVADQAQIADLTAEVAAAAPTITDQQVLQ